LEGGKFFVDARVFNPSDVLIPCIILILVLCHRYIALFAWTLVLWVTWVPLIKNNQKNPGDKSLKAVDLIGKLLFGFFICAAVLLFEKFSIQWIAGKFHERSYAGMYHAM
jgi:hypothetical protein